VTNRALPMAFQMQTLGLTSGTQIKNISWEQTV